MSPRDPFGFSAANKIAARLADIKPEPEKQPARIEAPVLTEIDKLAERHGFQSREPGQEKILRRRRDVGPSAQLNVKCPIPVYNRFVRFCDQERLSYWEGIEKLLDLANASSGQTKSFG